MNKQTPNRRALRFSRPDPERFFHIMVVFSQLSFSWSVARKTLLWAAGIALTITTVAMTGSAYGFWATKKIMSFTTLQRETAAQQQQIRDSLDQARGLEEEVVKLRQKVTDLLYLLDPKNPPPVIPPVPSSGGSAGKPAAEAQKLSVLKSELDHIETQARTLKSRMDPIIDRWNHTPSIPPTAGYLSSGFGLRISPFSKVNESDERLLGYHAGMDITNQEGTPIQATADGVVTMAGPYQKYGNCVVIRHSNEFETLYGHLSQIEVKEGQQVTRGDILGAMGRTGNATGVHLHYEVRRNSSTINPQPYLRLQRQWLSSLN